MLIWLPLRQRCGERLHAFPSLKGIDEGGPHACRGANHPASRTARTSVPCRLGATAKGKVSTRESDGEPMGLVLQNLEPDPGLFFGSFYA